MSFKCLIVPEKGRSYFCVSTASGRSEKCFVSFKFSNVMAKRAAVLAVDPVNGMGLFEYLETFYENGVGYEVFAVSDTTDIRTNSGVRLRADDTVGNLRGRSDDFDALVFACGDAVPLFAQHASEPHNVALLDVIREFGRSGRRSGCCRGRGMGGRRQLLHGPERTCGRGFAARRSERFEIGASVSETGFPVSFVRKGTGFLRCRPRFSTVPLSGTSFAEGGESS